MKGNKLKTVLIFMLLILSVFVSFIDIANAAAPMVTTNDATGILSTNATLQGSITNDGNTSFLYEQYITGDDDSVYSFGVWWMAQTFTPSYSFGIKQLGLKLYRGGTHGFPGIVTVIIQGTTGVYEKPDGINLSVGTTDGDTLQYGATTQFRNITMSSYNLIAGTKYSIIVKCIGSPNDAVFWRFDITSPTYSGGAVHVSGDSGTTWTLFNQRDFMFRVYGNGCNASFEYGYSTSYGNSTVYQTKMTGNTVSQNIASLMDGRLYHFRVKGTNLDGTTNGADSTFLTKPNVPLSIVPISFLNAINLTWTKGTGANRTLIRYSDSSYPLTITDGTLQYNNTGTSTNTTGLTPGKTYYFSLWSFTVWGALSQYSARTAFYASTLGNANFTFNFPQYLEVGDYLLASGTIVNITGAPVDSLWCHTIIYNESGINVTGPYRPFWVVNGFYTYVFSTSAMIPGVYFIRLNFTQGGLDYNTTSILYLSQPGGAGHARAMIYFTYYNTNEGIGLPTETLQLFVNDSRIYTYPLSYESYTGARINVKVKDYYNSLMFQQNYTINSTIQPINLGLTFHSWLFGNSNNKAYMVSLLKQGATRWWERGIVPYGQVEYLIPSGNYRMRIYDAAYTELINQSFLITNSRVYVINGTNLTLVINGQSIIIGQLLETLDYLFTPDVRIMRENPPMIFSAYDVDGMCLGDGGYLIDPALVVVATTRTETYGNWINSSARIPSNSSVLNGTVTVLKDELYIAGNASISWVNITYTSNGTMLQNTTYIPSKIDLYGQNVTINASEDVVVKRYTKYHQVTQISWLYKSYEGSYSTGVNISNAMATPLYDVYVMIELANTSNADGTSFVLRDIANNGTVMIYGTDFDVSLGCISFYILSINGSSSRTFTIEYRTSRSEFYSYGIAESRVDGYVPTVFQGGSYQFFYVDWINTGSLIFKGPLMVKLNFSRVLDIDPGSIIIQDRDRNIVLSSSGVTQAGDLLMFGSSILGDVNPGGGRSFAVYFLFKEYPGADPSVYKLSTPLFILFGVLPITLFLIGAVICGVVVTASALLYMFDRKGKRAHGFMVLMAVFSLGIFFLVILQLAGY